MREGYLASFSLSFFLTCLCWCSVDFLDITDKYQKRIFNTDRCADQDGTSARIHVYYWIFEAVIALGMEEYS